MKIFEILTNQDFIAAIITVIIFIILGYIFEKKKVIDSLDKTITFLVLNIGVPALVFKSFMCDFDIESLKTNFIVLLLSLIGYILLIVIGNLIFIKKEKQTRKVYAIIIALSQVSLFSLPIVNAIYKTNEALIPINILSIMFRIFLYGYSYAVFSSISGEEVDVKSRVKKVFINPIVIAMLIGIFVWITQDIAPKVNIDGEKISVLRVDKILSPLYAVIKYASNITTPLSMMLIGISIGKYNLKDAISSKLSWLLAVLRSIGGPLIMFILIVITKEVFNVNLSTYQMAGLLFAFAAPVSAVVNTYAIKFQKEEFISSSACFISSILSIIIFPIIYLIISIYA